MIPTPNTSIFFKRAAAAIFLMDSSQKCPQAYWAAILENGIWLGAKNNILEELPFDIGYIHET